MHRSRGRCQGTLTKEGGKREVVEEVVTKLLKVEDKLLQKNLLAITFTLSSLALDIPEDKEWLFRRFRMMQDIIRDTEIYQHIMQEGIEQEKQKELQRLRQMLITFVQARADDLVPFATKQAEQINDVEVLNELALEVGLAQSAEEIRRYLGDINEQNKH